MHGAHSILSTSEAGIRDETHGEGYVPRNKPSTLEKHVGRKSTPIVEGATLGGIVDFTRAGRTIVKSFRWR